MESFSLILAIVVVTALAFDFTNGFHDTANAMATTIATRALPPKVAVGVAAALNLVGAFLSLKVAATIAEGIVKADQATPAIIFAGLLSSVIIPALIAPVLAGLVAGIGTFLAYKLVSGRRPEAVSKAYRLGQVASGGLVSLAHGTNDAQKTMGVITL